MKSFSWRGMPELHDAFANSARRVRGARAAEARMWLMAWLKRRNVWLTGSEHALVAWRIPRSRGPVAAPIRGGHSSLHLLENRDFEKPSSWLPQGPFRCNLAGGDDDMTTSAA